MRATLETLAELDDLRRVASEGRGLCCLDEHGEVTPRLGSELALDDLEHHARELDRVRAPQLKRRETPAHARADRGHARPLSDAEQPADRRRRRAPTDGWSCSKPQSPAPDLAAAAAVARRTATYPRRGSRSSSVRLEALLDPQQVAAALAARRGAPRYSPARWPASVGAQGIQRR